VLTDKRDWLQTLDANELDLETAKNAMKIKKSYYEIEYLDYPRTVCASAQHIEIVLDDQGQQKILYKTICHEHCGLNDVPPEMSHCNQLQRCWAMQNSNNCHVGLWLVFSVIMVRYFGTCSTIVFPKCQKSECIFDGKIFFRDKCFFAEYFKM
jgi:hypothetical protein